ncbi:hypothetical protein GCM10007860_25660 [Chitiniphilus shinanonensis]|uniref:Uncharacterized protein n=2 Tax=Chitiniphilus shinanonensis TaxID=553088 RepID=A0ABQ6BUS7_9NEIS|nr:hypothetical protein GCM10007860_25660 [Chitiniphilus shinanonensis]
MVYSPSLTQLGGSASGAVPDEAGVIRTFGTTQFSADTQVVDLMGDASYVVAGFTNGQVTTSTNPGGIAISDTSYWYTAAFNRFAAMPADAAPTCAGRFTVPTSGSVKGTIQGTASLAVVSGTATATIQLDMTPAGGAAATTIGQTATFDASSLSSVKVSGGFLSSGSGMATALGEGVNGGFVLVSPWKIVLANNTLYSGIAVFTCN